MNQSLNLIQVNVILAVDEGGVLGLKEASPKSGSWLPWDSIPEDFANFRKLTTNKTVVMGSKTWFTLPEKYRPLPNRVNVVMSRTHTDASLGAVNKVIPCVDFDNLRRLCRVSDIREICVIGGKEIYSFFLSKDGVSGFEIASIHRTLVSKNCAANESGVALSQEEMQNFVRIPEMVDPIKGYSHLGFVCNGINPFPWGKIEFLSKPIAHDGLTTLSGNLLEAV